MKEAKVSAQVVPDYRRKLKEDKYPLKLKITFKGERRYYGTKYALTKNEWGSLRTMMTVSKKLKEIRHEIFFIENKAEKIIEKIIPFSFRSFENDFFEKPIKYSNLLAMYNIIINQFEKEGRIGTAILYRTAINSLESFKPNLKLDKITIQFLHDYEKWMIDRNNSVTTISMYLRTLRAMINRAISESQFDYRLYPFGRNKYLIPSRVKSKKSLDLTDIRKIFNYVADKKNYFECRSLDFWKFSYLASGINIMDIAKLKWKNIDEDTISFIRSKTQNTNRQAKDIIIPRNELIDSIIDKWGIISTNKDSFVFNIITENDNPFDIKKKITQFIQVTNKNMKDIGNKLGIKTHITTYVARHSFSTILLRSGASVEFISDSLGHANIKTTQHYLGGFDLETKKETMKALIDF